MTRFARAKGSKSSNERLPEEATSWTEMKEQLLNKEKEASETENRNAMNTKRLENFNSFLSDQKHKDGANSEWADFSNLNTITKKTKNEVKEKKIKKRNIVNDNDDPLENNGKVKKIKVKKTNVEVQDNNSLENAVKKKKIKVKKTNVEVNVIEEEYRKMEVQDKEINNDLLENNVKKKIKVKKTNAEVNVTEEEHTVQDKKIHENNLKKKKMKVKKTNVAVNATKPLEEMTEEERSRHTRKMERRRLQKEKRKLYKLNQIGENQNGIPEANDDKSQSTQETDNSALDGSEGKSGKGKKKPKGVMKPQKPLEELTEKEREAVAKKQARRQRQLEKRKLLKEKKENNASDLNKPQIKKKPPKDRTGKEAKRKKPMPEGETLHLNGRSIEIVYVDGFPVKKEDGERLAELKKTMISKGLPRSEVQAGMKLARRRAEKALTREKRNVCFKCRQSGHNLSECPQLMNEETIASGICFKCGSTEHTHFECKVVRRQEFKFATCFICNEQGHISKQCPDNARGLYPKGGACKLCGDVTHLKKDCPKRIAEQEASTIGLETIGGDVEGLDGESKVVVHNKPNKIVKFF